MECRKSVRDGFCVRFGCQSDHIELRCEVPKTPHILRALKLQGLCCPLTELCCFTGAQHHGLLVQCGRLHCLSKAKCMYFEPESHGSFPFQRRRGSQHEAPRLIHGCYMAGLSLGLVILNEAFPISYLSTPKHLISKGGGRERERRNVNELKNEYLHNSYLNSGEKEF